MPSIDSVLHLQTLHRHYNKIDNIQHSGVFFIYARASLLLVKHLNHSFFLFSYRFTSTAIADTLSILIFKDEFNVGRAEPEECE